MILILRILHWISTRAEKHGYAAKLEWSTLSVETLVSALRKAVNDKETKERLGELSALFRATRQSPLERSIRWIEFVMRHPGAAHLIRPESLSLYWFQYLCLDIALFLLLTSLLAVWGLYKAVTTLPIKLAFPSNLLYAFSRRIWRKTSVKLMKYTKI